MFSTTEEEAEYFSVLAQQQAAEARAGLRREIATRLMLKLVNAEGSHYSWSYADVAENAVKYADALLEELDKPKEE